MTTDPDTFDIGPTPPPWTLPGARPSWDSLTDDDTTILSWVRDVGGVWIASEDTIKDGQWVRSPAVIRFSQPDGLDAAAARQLAAQLISAARRVAVGGVATSDAVGCIGGGGPGGSGVSGHAGRSGGGGIG